jgi:glycosyltransferase involved in cell wall biosynthesis
VELLEQIRDSAAVVLPSECYENNPRSVLEAFASGKPVIGSRIGGIPELVKDRETGLLFSPGDPRDLREKILGLLKRPDMVAEMGKNARRLIEEKLNPDEYYRGLTGIYENAMAARRLPQERVEYGSSDNNDVQVPEQMLHV